MMKDSRGDSATIRNFLRILCRDGVWGVSESLLAIAMLFECDIIIHRELEFTTKVENEDESTTHRLQIVIVYRGARNQWNHYESFMHFVNDDPAPGDKTTTMETLETDWWSSVNHNSGTCIVLKHCTRWKLFVFLFSAPTVWNRYRLSAARNQHHTHQKSNCDTS